MYCILCSCPNGCKGIGDCQEIFKGHQRKTYLIDLRPTSEETAQLAPWFNSRSFSVRLTRGVSRCPQSESNYLYKRNEPCIECSLSVQILTTSYNKGSKFIHDCPLKIQQCVCPLLSAVPLIASDRNIVHKYWLKKVFQLGWHTPPSFWHWWRCVGPRHFDTIHPQWGQQLTSIEFESVKEGDTTEALTQAIINIAKSRFGWETTLHVPVPSTSWEYTAMPNQPFDVGFIVAHK